MDEITKEKQTSLGQLFDEAAYPFDPRAEVNTAPWDCQSDFYRAAKERGAQAVAAHVRAESAAEISDLKTLLAQERERREMAEALLVLCHADLNVRSPNAHRIAEFVPAEMLRKTSPEIGAILKRAALKKEAAL